MARKPTGNPNGRPEKEINFEMFEDLCSFQCTQSEMASFFRIDKKTLIKVVEKKYGDSFSTVYKQFSEKGLCSLRRTLFVLSKKNATTAIHLSKVLLGNKEVVVNESRSVVAAQKAILALPDNGRRKPQ